MNDTIQEYELRGGANRCLEVEMPAGASVIGVIVKDDRVYLYAYVDRDEKKKIKRHFAVVETGAPLPEEPRHHLGSFCINGHTEHTLDGPRPVPTFVGHVFTDRKEYPL